ncbi:MAG: DUF6516 family protein [Candidatus Lokiarchaeia archaeon]
MISYISFLQKARALLIKTMNEKIKTDELNEDLSQLKIILKSGHVLYIRYNEFGEYGYQIIYSPKKNDFSRFDNFDDKWDVSTKPHHLHIKGNKNAIASPMKGTPDHDMPILVKFFNEGKI